MAGKGWAQKHKAAFTLNPQLKGDKANRKEGGQKVRRTGSEEESK